MILGNVDGVSVVLNKLQGVDPKNIIVVADYDLTLAKKSVVNFHEAPLEEAHYRGLCRLAPQIRRFVVLTARGKVSASDYLTPENYTEKYGFIPNLSLGSNSGHIWTPNIARSNSVSEIIPIPDCDEATAKDVSRAIKSIIRDMQAAYPDITADPRELCGAVVYQFKNDDNSAQYHQFHALADNLRQAFPSDISARILFEPVHRQVENQSGDIETQGYIDLKPRGMDKGHTTKKILADWITNKTVLIGAGDSKADKPMLEALATLVPPERMIGISVGKGLVGLDCVNVALLPNGHSPIDMLHAIFDLIGEPEALDVRSGMGRHVTKEPVVERRYTA